MSSMLQQRIDVGEQRLLERQQQFRQHWQALGLRVERATAPRRLVAPVLVAVFSLLATGWLLRRVVARGVSEPVPRGERAAGAGWPARHATFLHGPTMPSCCTRLGSRLA